MADDGRVNVVRGRWVLLSIGGVKSEEMVGLGLSTVGPLALRVLRRSARLFSRGFACVFVRAFCFCC